MIHNKFRYLLTLVALFAISTGAWAQEEVLLTTVTPTSITTYSQSPDGIVTVTISGIDAYNSNYGWYYGGSVTVEAAQGYTITRCVFKQGSKKPLVDNLAPFTATFVPDLDGGLPYVSVETSDGPAGNFAMNGITSIEVYGTAEPPIDVTPGSSANTWTFAMPGSDVVLTPQYALAAQLDENGAPAAVSGLEIAADAAIITAGQSAQGTLLYAVGTSATEKPALTAFAATLPNAKDQTAAGNYYVWYYIQGQDTPQGQEPTAENTFNDSEIMGPVKVELLTNEHTLNIKQSPNITVTVAGTAVTPTDDKVTPVTTGQEVKIKAKDGYKFRKVEVKKGAGKTITIGDVELTYADGDTWETIVSKNSDKIKRIAGGYIVQVAQPAPNQYKYLKVVLSTNKVNPSDIIDPSKNYEWGTIEVYS